MGDKGGVVMKLTGILKENAAAYYRGYRRALNEGGTYSSKTYSILQLLILIAKSAKESLLISVVSESLPHLKRGAIRDFFIIMEEDPEHCERWSRSEFIYKFGNGVIEFFGADDAGKVRGPRRQILFLNEANNISWETARGLDIRTELFTFADWNPVGEFWAHENWIGDTVNKYIHSTYLDAKEAEVLPQSVIDNIESNKDKDPNWWNIYGLGLIGKVEGLVYPTFGQVDELPLGTYFYGLDYGFASDPTVLVKNVIVGGNLYSQEMLYDSSGLTNEMIARKLNLLQVVNEPIYPDPNEPKSAEEIRQKGYNVKETVKGPGSVEFGIQKVNQYYQFWTKDSLNCIQEQRNHRYLKDRITGVFTDKTTHQWSHGLDARRYGVASHRIFLRQGPIEMYHFSPAVRAWR